MSANQLAEVETVLPGLGRRVLLVDDDRLQAKLLHAQLEAAGFVVNLASSATEAMSALERTDADAVLSDVMMDEVDGFSLCKMLRSNPAFSGLPVVLVSSYFNDGADRELAREVGADALIPRTPSCQPAVEALVRSLADSRLDEPANEEVTSERHLRCVSNQLTRFRRETTEAETRYRAVFEHANDAMCILTPDGVVVELNGRWEEIMQKPREELLGLHVRAFSAADDESENVRKFFASASKASGRDALVPIRRGDGSVAYMDFTTTRMELDGCERILTIGRDVTDVVESRRKLAATERRYQSLVENTPAVLWSSTVDLEIDFVSSNVAKVLPFDDHELTEHPTLLVDRVHADDVTTVRATFAESARTGNPIDVEFRWLGRDEHLMWLHCRAHVTRGADGQPRFDGVLCDVSARKGLEEQLCHAQKIETIGQLTAGLAHDFRNILSVVVANLDYLSSLCSGEQTEVIGDIREAAKRGAELTNGLMSFARREATVPRDVSMNVIVEDIRSMLARAVGSGVELHVVPNEEPGTVRVDRHEIEQVLMNLAVNARDAMPTGGRLTIEVANVDMRHVEPRKGQPGAGEYVALAVRDTGTGMDAQTLQHLFEPFFTTKESGRGTGLGLSTSYGIVKRYGGMIAVESTPGVGTTFTVYLPRVEAAS
jgi:PAS domain S-box-containing protein